MNFDKVINVFDDVGIIAKILYVDTSRHAIVKLRIFTIEGKEVEILKFNTEFVDGVPETDKIAFNVIFKSDNLGMGRMPLDMIPFFRNLPEKEIMQYQTPYYTENEN